MKTSPFHKISLQTFGRKGAEDEGDMQKNRDLND
jgi:hypothetical protein